MSIYTRGVAAVAADTLNVVADVAEIAGNTVLLLLETAAELLHHHAAGPR